MLTTRGGARFRYGPWRSDPSLGQIIPLPGGSGINEEAVIEATGLLAARGFDSVLTSALGPAEQVPFLDAGYRVCQVLRLLEIGLTRAMEAPLPEPGLRIRPARRRDMRPILELDAEAFDAFWRFDAKALAEAAHATPRNRRRVAQRDGRVVGYTMTGRSGRTGFVQRLAVDPDHHRRGTGRILLVDSLSWLQRSGATRALVNTQPENDQALALYRSTGFNQRPEGLAVLRLDRDKSSGG